jgi:tetratricopeptide (TPR) repeat protein
MQRTAFLFFLLISFSASAQDNTSEQLAIQYYQNNEFEKAALLFEELFESKPSSSVYYSYFLDCLLQLNDHDKALKELKKQVKRFPNQSEFEVDLGYIYLLLGDERKKKKHYNHALEKMPLKQADISRVANAFIKRKEYEYAIQVFKKGRDNLENATSYSFSLAELYKITGQHEKMLDEYIRLLYFDTRFSQSIQNKLQDEVQNDDFYQLTKTRFLKELQANDYMPVFVNVLSWLFIQKKDFEAAFRQQKALDKRNNNNNAGIISLADICISNKAYAVAEKAYQYILDKGPTTPYYFHSKFGLIEVKYLQLTAQVNPPKSMLEDIESHYTLYLNKDFYRYIDISEKVILRLAEVKAVYLKKVDEAINLLNKYIAYPRISKTSQAKMKLALGDYYVLGGDSWEASLLYMQVAKMYKDHPIGHEAKFRNAKLSFYRGNFNWANDQLDVLKASTSELIANDALYLSLLIQDVLGFDSNTTPLKMYARADFFIYKHQYDSAIMSLDSLEAQYPNHILMDEVYFQKGQIAEARGQYKEAVTFYIKVYQTYPKDLLADVAIYSAALLMEEKLNLVEEATALYEKIILDYPESVYVVDSRKRYRAYKNDVNEFLYDQQPPDIDP